MLLPAAAGTDQRGDLWSSEQTAAPAPVAVAATTAQQAALVLPVSRATRTAF